MRIKISKKRESVFSWVTVITMSFAFVCVTFTKQLPIADNIVKADTQLSGRPVQVLAGHLSTDPVAGRKDYVYIVKKDDNSFQIAAYTPDDQLLFATPPDFTNPPQELVDVTDLDGDGNCEIIAVTLRGGYALHILNGDGTYRQPKFIFTGTIARTTVRTYDVLPFTGQRRIAVAATDISPAKVYFFNSNGSLIRSQDVPQSAQGEVLGAPGLMAGNINNSGGNEIVIVAKQRILAFNQDGLKLYYCQFVDNTPGASFTNVTAPDFIAGANQNFEGRRYGLYKLMDMDGDGDLELVVAGDAQGVLLQGGVFEVYNLPATGPLPRDYLGYSKRVWLPRANRRYTQIESVDNYYPPPPYLELPVEYKVTTGFNSVRDINADNIPEIVVTEYPDGNPAQPFVRIVNIMSNTFTAPLINGICLGVSPQNPADLLIYNPNGRTY